MSHLPLGTRPSFMFAAAALVGAAVLGASGCSEDAPPCESTYDYFATKVWPVIGTKCISCHNAQGIAKDTSYVLKGPAEAGFLDHNLAVFSDLASFEKHGVSQVLLKPTMQIPHEGQQIFAQDSEEYRVLEGFVDKLKSGETCSTAEAAHYTGVELLDDAATLRKASLLLAARLPTADETAKVKAGGPAALEGVLATMMTEEPFFEFIKRTYNDLFLTDFYLGNVNAVTDALPYADAGWYQKVSKDDLAKYGAANAQELAAFTNAAVAREPLALIEHVVREGRPFTDILTADYMMVTPLSARSFGVEATFKNPYDPREWAEGRLPDVERTDAQGKPTGEAVPYPHAGVLSSPVMLVRHPSTPTNRNRARARKAYLWFLGTNILLTAEQPIDQTVVDSNNPTRDSATCTVCHANVDPVAGCFQAFNDSGKFVPDPRWYTEMWPAGFGDEKLPLEKSATGLPWLGRRLSQDPRFALSVVFTMYKALTGREPLIAPSDTTDPDYQAKFAAFYAQADTLRRIGEAFVASQYDLRVVFARLVESPYFRATNSVKLDDSARVRLGEVGRAQLLPPEQLHDKIQAVLGIPWADGNRNPYLRSQFRTPGNLGGFQLFYGGIDSNSVTNRSTSPNGVLASVAERMTIQMACRSVPYDFARGPDSRLLFPLVELDGKEIDPMTFEPETEAGLPIELAQLGIRKSLVHLHERILGESHAVDDPDIERAFTLFVEAWRQGKDGMKATEKPVPADLPYDCRVTADYFSGAAYPEERRVTKDETYVIRAWMAVVTYLLGDYRFLYE
ncbi:MAG: hypothetical protein FJ095_09380 [Deltaproteobacteria bacterium]|nr:hypothetical protein [Deltaproteobacteria bacterium]